MPDDPWWDRPWRATHRLTWTPAGGAPVVEVVMVVAAPGGEPPSLARRPVDRIWWAMPEGLWQRRQIGGHWYGVEDTATGALAWWFDGLPGPRGARGTVTVERLPPPDGRNGVGAF